MIDHLEEPRRLRVFSGGVWTETNTFAPLPTSVASFQERWFFPSGSHPDHPLYCSGPLWAARVRGRELGWALSEGLVAGAQPGGVVTRAAYESLRDQLLDDLRAALPLDVVLFGLHGAMVADGYDDCEGDLLARARAIVGPGVVIGAELDPHCHLTAEMVGSADVLVTLKEYPHTDVVERAFELVDLCAARARGEIRPIAALVDCEMVAVLHTTREPVRSFVDRLRARESRDGVLSVSVAHGFPWGDVPDMGTKVLVYADGDSARAAQVAGEVAAELRDLRERLRPQLLGIDEALDVVDTARGGVVVLADTADNPGGGAAGDATFVLARLLERGIRDVALGPLWDPGAARIAADAGAGARIQLRIGGKVSPLSGSPVDVVCTVKSIKHDHRQTDLAGAPVEMGTCALVEVDGGIELVLASIRTQALGTDLFTGIGCSLAEKRLIVVKSSQHFHAQFSKLPGAQVLYADSPGALTLDLASLPYHKVRRPKWPLDA
jgi:microcystin degradation protein MlrC